MPHLFAVVAHLVLLSHIHTASSALLDSEVTVEDIRNDVDGAQSAAQRASMREHDHSSDDEILHAFVVKYIVETVFKIEVAHTTLVVAPAADVEDDIAKFQAWCAGQRRWPASSCFKEHKDWVSESPLQLPNTATEYEFLETGITVRGFGKSSFYRYPRQVLPAGPVMASAVADAEGAAKECGKTEDGYLRDFNPDSFHAIEHNSHTFVDTMLHLLKLPYWEPGGGLPADFMPENKNRNLVKGTIVARLIGGGGQPFGASKTCNGTGVDIAASVGLDLGLDNLDLTF